MASRHIRAEGVSSLTSGSLESPLVSVVIPAYNHGRYVAEAITSVLAQDYPAIETIVINDGSTDETGQVLVRFADRVHVVTQSNAGQSATINRGWASARGELVSYLSADDRLRPGAVTAAVAALTSRPDVVMVYGDYVLIGPDSTVLRTVTAPEFDYDAMVRHLICAPGPGVFIRRGAAERAGGWDPDLRWAPDFEFWLRLGLVGPFARVPAVLADLRVHEGSASFAWTDPARAEEPVRIMTRYFERQGMDGLRASARQSLSSAHLVAARTHLRARRVADGVRNMHAAARLYPRTLLTWRAARLLTNAVLNRPLHLAVWAIGRARRSRRA